MIPNTTYFYDPEKWLTSASRALQEYLRNNFPSTFEIIVGVAPPDMVKVMPIPKTIVSLEIDDNTPEVLGFGDNVFAANYSAVNENMQPQEAHRQIINFNIDIYASDRSGGSTSLMRAYEILEGLFVGPIAFHSLRDGTEHDVNLDGGLEVVRYGRGQFMREVVNDQPLHRVVGGELDIRVYSRTPKGEPVDTIEEILQDDNLTIP